MLKHFLWNHVENEIRIGLTMTITITSGHKAGKSHNKLPMKIDLQQHDFMIFGAQSLIDLLLYYAAALYHSMQRLRLPRCLRIFQVPRRNVNDFSEVTSKKELDVYTDVCSFR